MSMANLAIFIRDKTEDLEILYFFYLCRYVFAAVR